MNQGHLRSGNSLFHVASGFRSGPASRLVCNANKKLKASKLLLLISSSVDFSDLDFSSYSVLQRIWQYHVTRVLKVLIKTRLSYAERSPIFSTALNTFSAIAGKAEFLLLNCRVCLPVQPTTIGDYTTHHLQSTHSLGSSHGRANGYCRR